LICGFDVREVPLAIDYSEPCACDAVANFQDTRDGSDRIITGRSVGPSFATLTDVIYGQIGICARHFCLPTKEYGAGKTAGAASLGHPNWVGL